MKLSKGRIKKLFSNQKQTKKRVVKKKISKIKSSLKRNKNNINIRNLTFKNNTIGGAGKYKWYKKFNKLLSKVSGYVPPAFIMVFDTIIKRDQFKQQLTNTQKESSHLNQSLEDIKSEYDKKKKLLQDFPTNINNYKNIVEQKEKETMDKINQQLKNFNNILDNKIKDTSEESNLHEEVHKAIEEKNNIVYGETSLTNAETTDIMNNLKNLNDRVPDEINDLSFRNVSDTDTLDGKGNDDVSIGAITDTDLNDEIIDDESSDDEMPPLEFRNEENQYKPISGQQTSIGELSKKNHDSLLSRPLNTSDENIQRGGAEGSLQLQNKDQEIFQHFIEPKFEANKRLIDVIDTIDLDNPHFRKDVEQFKDLYKKFFDQINKEVYNIKNTILSRSNDSLTSFKKIKNSIKTFISTLSNKRIFFDIFYFKSYDNFLDEFHNEMKLFINIRLM